jgi:PIN domain nuclease of toxin-antitoxin system
VILLDTCALIWDALDAGQLSAKARQAIEKHEHQLLICDISIWEIAMLIGKERLLVDDTASGFIKLALQARNYQVQAITPEIAELSVSLGADVGNDPADRLIAATSVLCGAAVVTADQNLQQASVVETIW